ncbi:alpha/beta hydrolase family protein [Nocardia brevicatena]|uniref:alpha/beta hydrolase family protein n=1 Tax=Nocardia brevicatena TaxID=37327 RepID=UPI000300D4BA|nr:lipase family protein [Nocardia brevicatena]
MRRALSAVLAVIGVLALVSGSSVYRPEAPSGVVRGETVSVTSVLRLTAEQTAAYLSEHGDTTSVANGVSAYRVVYTTVDPRGVETTASGLVVLPRTDTHRLRVVGYEHGTIVRRDEAPSAAGETERARAVMFAAAGYAVVAPDYLGLGTGPGRHPYAHAPTEATASVDLLRAARTLVAREGHELDGNVLVTGFSQGGQAAVALGRELRDGKVPGFAPAAVAAVSGPYDVRHAQAPAALDGRVTPRAAVIYLAYWITAMNGIYHFYDDPTEAFRPPFAGRVERLFDGTHGLVDIALNLPATPAELLTPRYIDWARDPDGAAARAMDDSDIGCDWVPEVPVRLYAATGDRSVPYENARRCMREPLGVGAELVDLGDIDHGATAGVALPRILDWFQQLVPPR